MEKHTCVKPVWVSYHHYPCGKTAKVQRDGKWYCGTHDPERLEKKRAERNARWDEETYARFRKSARSHAAELALSAIEASSPDEAVRLQLSYKPLGYNKQIKRLKKELTEMREARKGTK